MTPPVLTTRRLTLRPITLDDADAIANAMRNWDVVQWLTAPPFPYARTDAVHFINEIAPKSTNWAIDAGDGLIGAISVQPDLGYWLDAEFHGQHVMSEAAEAVVHWYFSQTDLPLMSGHFCGNSASRAILLKLGFTDVGAENQIQHCTQETVVTQRMTLIKNACTA
ncbi:GNAT family N-acetyltransferase [Yoonia sp. MH D7]